MILCEIRPNEMSDPLGWAEYEVHGKSGWLSYFAGKLMTEGFEDLSINWKIYSVSIQFHLIWMTKYEDLLTSSYDIMLVYV